MTTNSASRSFTVRTLFRSESNEEGKVEARCSADKDKETIENICESCESCEKCDFMKNGDKCNKCKEMMFIWAAEQCGVEWRVDSD